MPGDGNSGYDVVLGLFQGQAGILIRFLALKLRHKEQSCKVRIRLNKMENPIICIKSPIGSPVAFPQCRLNIEDFGVRR